jgi:hypothetical protein
MEKPLPLASEAIVKIVLDRKSEQGRMRISDGDTSDAGLRFFSRVPSRAARSPSVSKGSDINVLLN